MATPEEIQRNLEESRRTTEVLKRKDGTVVTQRDGNQFVEQGDLRISSMTVDPAIAARAGVPSNLLSDLSGVQISKGFTGSGPFLKAAPSGLVITDKGMGYDCKLATEVRLAVADSLKDGVVTPTEASHLEALASNAPNPQGKREACKTQDM